MKKSLVILLSVTVLFLSCGKNRTESPQDRLCVNDERINEIIAGMSLEEKVEMLHSKTIMSSEGIPRLGIPEIKYADGPLGVREELGDKFRPLKWTTDSASYFPTGSALAATWSREMAYKFGVGIGREGRIRGKDVLLCPAINIQRLPVGGRTYEYLSEDPCLSAVLATEFTKGCQSTGTAVCLKHFAVNNQETNRGSLNAVIAERPLREIYLKPFEKAVREGGAMTVMTAYNKVNGLYCSENAHLNNDILRGEWGFKGFTVSDWGGTHSTMGAALGGLDVQMTGDEYLGPALIDSVRNGAVPESVVDDKVREILRVRFAVEAIPADKCNLGRTSLPEQQRIAYEVASKSIVLLKNDGILPLKPVKVALIGPNAELRTAKGGVGAGVKAAYEITVLQGFKDRGIDFVYSADDARVAADADIVVFVCGTNREVETEGRDRLDIFLPEGQEALLERIAAINPDIVTVVLSGGPCDLHKVNALSRAVVQGWWNGMENGHALADVLTGAVVPSGKLPFTFPVKLEDSPAYATGSYPQVAPVGADLFSKMFREDRKEGKKINGLEQIDWEPEARYPEGIFVGYRWYDTKNVPVLYAFGHGLSYVEFTYSDIKVGREKYRSDEFVSVNFNLTNAGKTDAEEIVQLYVGRPDAGVEWPVKELKAFDRIALKAGETRNVTLEFPVSDLRWWDERNSCWSLEEGRLDILVGSSSDDIRLASSCLIKR